MCNPLRESGERTDPTLRWELVDMALDALWAGYRTLGLTPAEFREVLLMSLKLEGYEIREERVKYVDADESGKRINEVKDNE